MQNSTVKKIFLTEYIFSYISKSDIPFSLGEQLWRNYSGPLQIDFPSPKTGHKWRLLSRGAIGYIPLKNHCFILQPRVTIHNLFLMLEYAYKLKIKILPGLVECGSLQEFYQLLVVILTRKVLALTTCGLYRSYYQKTDILPFICGRMDMARMARSPWNLKFHCHYQENSINNEDNQILLWTLYEILHSGLCSSYELANVRRAYLGLQKFVDLIPQKAHTCINRHYNRLNEHYRPLHALCRFFLENSGPKFATGQKKMLPFLIYMPHLFELFVAYWLKSHLPQEFTLHIKEWVEIGQELHFAIDIVLYDRTGKALCVMDTKYKTPDKPSNSDIFQIVTYAKTKNCHEGILIYPSNDTKKIEEKIGDICVRSLAFSVTGDLYENGRKFIAELFREL